MHESFRCCSLKIGHIDFFLALGVLGRPDNSSRVVVFLDQGFLGVSRRCWLLVMALRWLEYYDVAYKQRRKASCRSSSGVRVRF